jgi:hypothetical protein
MPKKMTCVELSVRHDAVFLAVLGVRVAWHDEELIPTKRHVLVRIPDSRILMLQLARSHTAHNSDLCACIRAAGGIRKSRHTVFFSLTAGILPPCGPSGTLALAVQVSNHVSTGDLMLLYRRPERYVHLVTARLPKRVTQVLSKITMQRLLDSPSCAGQVLSGTVAVG